MRQQVVVVKLLNIMNWSQGTVLFWVVAVVVVVFIVVQDKAARMEEYYLTSHVNRSRCKLFH